MEQENCRTGIGAFSTQELLPGKYASIDVIAAQTGHTHTQVRQAHKPQQPQQPQIPQIRRRVGDRAQRAAAASAYAGGWQRGM